MKFLTIAQLKETADRQRVRDLMDEHARAMWLLHKEQSVRSIEQLADRPGVALIIECDLLSDVETLLQRLPLMREGLTTAETFSLKPYDAWERLFHGSGSTSAGVREPR